MSSGADQPDNLLEGTFDESERLRLLHADARARTHTHTHIHTPTHRRVSGQVYALMCVVRWTPTDAQLNHEYAWDAIFCVSCTGANRRAFLQALYEWRNGGASAESDAQGPTPQPQPRAPKPNPGTSNPGASVILCACACVRVRACVRSSPFYLLSHASEHARDAAKPRPCLGSQARAYAQLLHTDALRHVHELVGSHREARKPSSKKCYQTRDGFWVRRLCVRARACEHIFSTGSRQVPGHGVRRLDSTERVPRIDPDTQHGGLTAPNLCPNDPSSLSRSRSSSSGKFPRRLAAFRADPRALRQPLVSGL